MKKKVVFLGLLFLVLIGMGSSLIRGSGDSSALISNDITWISPGIVEIERLLPGSEVEFSLTVHSGDIDSKWFTVSYSKPVILREEYLSPPLGAGDWISIDESSFILGPGESRDLLITFKVPKDTKLPTSSWEFWVTVRWTQSNTVNTELSCRVLINVR